MVKLVITLASRISLILLAILLLFIKPTRGLDLKKSPESEKNLIKNSSNESYIPIVRVFSPASPGSGVVIGKKDNTYTLITAKHVIGNFSVNRLDEIEIEIGPDFFVNPMEVIIPFEDKDLAVLRFKSDLSIKLALLPFLDKPLWEKVSNWENITVQGFANESSGIKEATFRKTEGSLLSLIEKSVDGYNLIHTSTTTTGMSGGGIFSNDSYNLFAAASPKVIDPEAKPLVYYYDSQKDIDQRQLTHRDWLEQNKHKTGDNFFEPFWDENIHSKAQNAMYKKCMTNKWLPKKDIIEKSSEPFFMLSFPNPEEQLGNENISDRTLWRHCEHLAEISDTTYNCKSFEDWQGKNELYILLAIHGRAEKYAYGGKSGAGIGIYLGEEEIAKWLEMNSINFGLKQNYGYAKRFCSHK